MNKKCEVFQEDHSDCAAACLSSIIKYYNGYMSLEDIKNQIKTTKNGTNAYDLIEGAKEIGFDAQGIKCNFEELIKMDYPLPLIAHIRKDEFYHFVVIYEFDKSKNEIFLMDPSIGFKKVSFDDFKNNYLNVVLVFIKTKELPKNIQNKKLLKVFKKTMLDYKLKILITFFISLILFILSLIQINLYKNLFSVNLNTINLKQIVISLLVVLLIKNLVELLKNFSIIKIKYMTDIKMNKEVFKNIFLLSYDYLKNKTTGEIVSRINDVELLKDVFIDLILNAFVNILLVVIFLFIILKISLPLVLVVFLYILLYLLTTFHYKNKYKVKTREIQEYKGKYTNDLIESIDSLETINNLGIKDFFSLKINNSYYNYVKKIKYFNKLTTTEHFFKNILSDTSILLLIIICIYLIKTNNLSVSNAIIIYMIFTYITNILYNLLERIPDITYALNNIEKTSMLFNGELETKKDNLEKGDIEIRKLSYITGNKEIIHNLSLDIPLKSKLCLTGKSGIGKSTILKILLKYKSEYKGIITINNKDLKTISKDFICNNFIYIGQNEKIFAGSLMYNIVLNRDVKKSDIDKVMKICFIDEILKNKALNNFYIEPDGFNLSGGERQRIILARGLLKKCEYILIDEALSEVDASLEIRIIKNILTEFKDKTIIYVSHKKEVQSLFKSIYNLERRKYE